MGALMKIDSGSSRSITGGIGSPGGDGVMYSPTSVLSSATVPANGARSSVKASCTSAAATLDSAWPTAATAASQPARVRSRSLANTSRRWSLAIPCRCRASARASSFSASSAARQASLPCARAAATVACAECSSARWARLSSATRRTPARTRSPSRCGSSTTRPPICGDSCARRRTLTVPARVLVTVSSTTPRSAAATRTSTGSGARTVIRSTTTRATDAIAAAIHVALLMMRHCTLLPILGRATNPGYSCPSVDDSGEHS